MRFAVIVLCAALAGCHEKSEAEDQVARAGLDYCAIKRRATRDARALPDYFRLTLLTDAAGAEGYAGDLEGLLDRWGEADFLRALDATPPKPREAILGDLAYSKGLGQAGSDWSRFSVRYPALARRVASANR